MKPLPPSQHPKCQEEIDYFLQRGKTLDIFQTGLGVQEIKSFTWEKLVIIRGGRVKISQSSQFHKCIIREGVKNTQIDQP